MALEVSTTWIVSATTISYQDNTGDYNAVTNTGGYGAPNAEFTDFAHYAIIRKKGVNGTADAVLALTAYDPLTATLFTAPRATDGWYEGIKLNITIWAAGARVTGDVRYHDGVVYIAAEDTSAEPGVDADWTVVSDLTTIEDNPSLTATTLGKATPYNADVYWSKQIAANAQAGKCGICQDDRQKKRLDEIRFHIQATYVADAFGDFTAGEWNVLSLLTMGAKPAA